VTCPPETPPGGTPDPTELCCNGVGGIPYLLPGRGPGGGGPPGSRRFLVRGWVSHRDLLGEGRLAPGHDRACATVGWAHQSSAYAENPSETGIQEVAETLDQRSAISPFRRQVFSAWPRRDHRTLGFLRLSSALFRRVYLHRPPIEAHWEAHAPNEPDDPVHQAPLLGKRGTACPPPP
jgi:hypothetical protein